MASVVGMAELIEFAGKASLRRDQYLIAATGLIAYLGVIHHPASMRNTQFQVRSKDCANHDSSKAPATVR
jgi:hypothetical protein